MFYLLENKFPPLEYADPNGLLAIGGILSSPMILNAYTNGIFPWYSEDEPILWYSPNPRCVLFPKDVYVSKSMKQILHRHTFDFSINTCFEDVIENCRKLREDTGTWLGNDMIGAYTRLHNEGFAHSIEVWQNGQLVGGLYGLAIGKVFFGESMFSLVSNASKAALIFLCTFLDEDGFEIIDCQVSNPHLLSMGAIEIDRNIFIKRIKEAITY